MSTPTKFSDEFLVNSTTAGSQLASSITALADGRFVVTWQDGSLTGGDTSDYAIRAQVFTARGFTSGDEFLVNTTTADEQIEPSIAGLSDGRFVVVWSDYSRTGGDTDSYAVRGQIYNVDGSESGSEFLVTTTTVGNQITPSVTALEDGEFVVTWMDSSLTGGDNSSYGIRAQVFDDTGSKSGSEFLVNTTTTDGQRNPDVTLLSDGKFVVTWDDFSQTGGDTSSFAIRGQMFDADGTKSGSEFLVNTTTANQQIEPSIVGLTGGGFVIVWTDDSVSGGDTSDSAVRAQVFDASGTATGSEILVNTTTSGEQSTSDVAALADGRFVIAWQDESATGDDTSGFAIRAQVFEANGTAADDEFVVNTTTASDQTAPSITVLADGRFVVSWTDDSQTGDDTAFTAVRSQIFDPREEAVDLTGTVLGDDLIGTAFDDSLGGGLGNDRIKADDGNDDVSGGDGDDVLRGNSGADTMDGGAGNDTLRGGAGDDTLDGGDDDDVLRGARGQDELNGGDGNDVLRGDLKGDTLMGGAGDDTLIGGRGKDVLTGGDGADTFVFRTDFGRDKVMDFEDDIDTILLEEALWGGGLTAAEVLDTYGTQTGSTVLLDFGEDVFVFKNISDINDLEDDISFA
ncbi:calcium-binding protein [Tropicimonas marinistellae]|uniref:calcium-binding protein n=1 Tax=Tropicimonas marinistellae TaxID=1739787 RepID=UPI000834131B|nr:hypothetical protein [Tropicimonas marinistellae]